MSSKDDSSSLSRVIVATMIIMGSAGLYSILFGIWQEKILSNGERFMGVIAIIIFVVVLAYVLKQRLQMRKTETFRREKW
ncbi:MAG: hypothetical protein HQ508_03375 [Candidatus Marinimicrobia bacterium]|nr:hypothetical protein [Candidatus Neomarinimicrobiota bacterium]